jgi:hypothetical protein
MTYLLQRERVYQSLPSNELFSCLLYSAFQPLRHNNYFTFTLESCKYRHFFLYFIQISVSLCEVVPGPGNRTMKTWKVHILILEIM